jgi:hypothetical protein
MNPRAATKSVLRAKRSIQQVLRGCALAVAVTSHAQAQEPTSSAAPAAAPVAPAPVAPSAVTTTVSPSPAPYAATPAPPPQTPAPQAPPTAAPPPVVYAAPPGYVLVPTSEQPEEPRRRRRQRAHRPSYTAGSPLPQGMLPPPVFRYTEGTPIPEGYHLESRANRGLIQGGVVTIGIPYIASAIVGLSLNLKDGSSWLLLPVAGPWLTLGTRRTRCGEIGDPSPAGLDCFGDEVGCSSHAGLRRARQRKSPRPPTALRSRRLRYRGARRALGAQ